ncbi:hypothetical protein D3C87_103640 [compost metagenome]
MRWSNYLLSAGVICALSLTACKQESTTSSIRGKGKMGPQSTKLVGKSGEELQNLCIADLCGEAKKYAMETLVAAAGKPTEEQKKFYETNIKEKIDKKISSEVAYLEALLGILKSRESEISGASLSDEQQRLLKSLYAARNVGAQEGYKDAAFMKAYEKVKKEGPEAYFQDLYKDQDLHEAQKIEAEGIKNIKMALNSFLGIEIFEPQTMLYTRITNGEVIVGDELRDFVNESIMIRIAGAGNKNPERNKAEISEQKMKEIYTASKAKEELAEQAKVTAESAGQLETRYFEAVNILPQEEAINSFKEVAEKVRAQALLQIREQEATYSLVKDAKIYYSPTPKFISGAWLKFVEQTTASNEAKLVALKEYDAGKILTLVIARELTKSDKAEANSLIDLSIHEAILKDSSSVYVNFLALKAHHGVGLLAHQFGFMVAANSYSGENIKACLIEKRGDDMFLQDDFADIFSANINKALQNDIQNQLNLGCFVSEQTRVKGNVKASAPSITRAIQIQLASGKALPASCETYAKKSAPKALEVCQ